MNPTISIICLLLIKTCLSQNLNNFFHTINEKTEKFNAIAADIVWESSINPSNPELPGKSAIYQKKRIVWQHKVCNKLGTLYNRQLLNETQRRQSYLLCRGPKFTYDEARLTSSLYEELQTIYTDAEVCIPSDINLENTTLSNIEDAILNYLSNVKQFLNSNDNSILFAAKIAVNGYPKEKERICLKGENDFEKMMAYSRKEDVLRWLWLVWREKVGPPMKEPYRRLADIENQAARRNGYPNIGASWRDELEMPRLRQHCRHLFNSVQPLFKLLHGVVRFYLRRFYGDIVPRRGPIPAHLLGNLWSQNWESLSDLLLPKSIDLDKSIKELNWTVMHMVKRAEDFYQSLGLPAMTEKFWRNSVFAREKYSDARCHGTAADMFQDGDYRLLYCSDTSKEDFYVLHHELGHIQYYMAYKNQPALYRVIIYTNIIKDITTDMILLFKQALNKIPQIPFALVIDEYRWKYFEGGLEKDNKGFWDLVEELQGIAPPEERGEEYFDAGAKFHVPDNTPYIRYFLSSFLQHQLFEKLCKAAVFGRRSADGPIPESITLSRCDIYGSKAAGKVLKDLMSRGHSQHWSEILQATINQNEITASSLNRYYRPLYEMLETFVLKHRVPIGW